MDIFCKVLTSNDGTEKMEILWARYLHDFIHYKLLASIETTDTERYLMEVLKEYFSPLQQEVNVLHRIIALHIHINLNHLHLARVVSTLLSVNQLIRIEESFKFIRPMVQEQNGETISCRMKDLAIYIATDMFNALTSAIECKEDFQTWYNGYFNMVSY